MALLLAALATRTMAEDYKPAEKDAPPTIFTQPETQVVPVGGNVTFSVQADNPPVTRAGPQFTYQWLRMSPGSKEFVSAPGVSTNNTYTIVNVTTNQVAHYSVKVISSNGARISEPASLIVAITNDTRAPFVYFGAAYPIVGTLDSCPGHYIGYVNFRKSVAQGWGWAPDHFGGNTAHTGTDANRADTIVQAMGNINDNYCATNAVTIVHSSTEDGKFRFTIYFSNNVPTTPYPITLSGFVP